MAVQSLLKSNLKDMFFVTENVACFNTTFNNNNNIINNIMNLTSWICRISRLVLGKKINQVPYLAFLLFACCTCP